MASVDELEKPRIRKDKNEDQNNMENPFSWSKTNGLYGSWNEQQQPSVEYKTAAEYAQAVQLWLQYVYMQWTASTFPLYVMHCMMQQNVGQHIHVEPPRTTERTPTTLFGHFTRQVRNAIRARNQQPVGHRGVGIEFKIPRLWKRFTAEFIDFAILFLLKLFVTFIVMDFFNLVNDLQKYDLETLQEKALDYKLALQVTSEIFLLELIHRTVVCIFEALCIHKGTVGVGGATPGKSLLGLRVVSCESIQVVPGNRRIVVWPAGDLGFGRALLRAIIKNFSMAFFLPACFTLLFFPYNRTIYDIACGCIVVEDIQPPARWN